MERFNVALSYHNVGGTGNEVPTALRSSILADDGAYQLAVSHTFNMVPALLSEGALCDFNKLPYVDLNKPWWNASIRDNLTIMGILPIAVSDLVYSYADVIYVDQDIIGDFSLENPYDLVFDGKWTWQKLAEMAKAVAGDLNGDGKFTVDDRYGFAFPGETPSLMSRLIHSNGMMMAAVRSDGTPELLAVSDRLQTSLERYYSLLYEDDKTYFATVTDTPNGVEAFSRGNILFLHQTTLQLPAMRGVDVNFGIVPLPKYDEAQENYMSMLSSQILLVPNTDEDELSFIGPIVEALSYESWKRVVPAVYDSIFESKYLRDATSYEMWEAVRSSLVCDFNWNYGGGNDVYKLVLSLIRDSKSTDAASYLAACTPAVNKSFEDLFENVKTAYQLP